MRFFRVIRHGHNLGDIYRYGLYTKLEKQRYIIRIMSNHTIKERLNRCFGGL
jgi:hypothetical protein